MNHLTDWNQVGAAARPNWYLDPLVARQKRDVHASLLHRWLRGLRPSIRVLKTDLFEEAWGEDSFFAEAFPQARCFGMDIATPVASRGAQACHALVTDARRLGLRTASLDVIISNSTLDHFPAREDLYTSLNELARVLRPGGHLLLTLDNPRNPLYRPLVWFCRTSLATFPLGYTEPPEALLPVCRKLGFEVLEQEWIIHNPRLLSTALALLARKLLGRFAGPLIGAMLAAFAQLGRTPLRRWSACFYAVHLRRLADWPVRGAETEAEGRELIGLQPAATGPIPPAGCGRPTAGCRPTAD